MLKVEDLSVHYGSIAAVQGISFEVEAGEIVGLIGPNGAGKSTTLSAIAGLLTPSRGAISFEGRSLIGAAPEKIVRRGVALVPEGRHIFGTLTVAENLLLGATPVKAGLVASELERVLERFPALKTYYHGSAAKLSGGEQQQLAIARALLSRPRLLLLDEPSLGLAPLVIDLVFDILAELRDEHVTILLVEQMAERTVAFADRTYVLRSGQMILSGERDDLMRTADFSTMYLGGS